MWHEWRYVAHLGQHVGGTHGTSGATLPTWGSTQVAHVAHIWGSTQVAHAALAALLWTPWAARSGYVRAYVRTNRWQKREYFSHLLPKASGIRTHVHTRQKWRVRTCEPRTRVRTYVGRRCFPTCVRHPTGHPLLQRTIPPVPEAGGRTPPSATFSLAGSPKNTRLQKCLCRRLDHPRKRIASSSIVRTYSTGGPCQECGRGSGGQAFENRCNKSDQSHATTQVRMTS